MFSLALSLSPIFSPLSLSLSLSLSLFLSLSQLALSLSLSEFNIELYFMSIHLFIRTASPTEMFFDPNRKFKFQSYKLESINSMAVYCFEKYKFTFCVRVRVCVCVLNSVLGN